jgi:5-oxoprolinase (ATP-hydrolysing)
MDVTSVQPQIQLRVVIDEKEGSAVLDFSGTGYEVRGNLNAPISVVHAAVIYCMRSMIDADIPLNAGCLVPLTSQSNDVLDRCVLLDCVIQSTSLRSPCFRLLGRLQCVAGTS